MRSCVRQQRSVDSRLKLMRKRSRARRHARLCCCGCADLFDHHFRGWDYVACCSRIGTHTAVYSKPTLSSARSRSRSSTSWRSACRFEAGPARHRPAVAVAATDPRRTCTSATSPTVPRTRTSRPSSSVTALYALPLRMALRLRPVESCRCMGAHGVATIVCGCAAVASYGAGSARGMPSGGTCPVAYASQAYRRAQ